MIAGALELQMFADLARLKKDMEEMKRTVNSATSSVESSIGSVKSAFASLGVGIGLVSLVSLVRGSIDAADHLNDLSKTTSLAVETLAGLKIAAKQSGSDLEGTAASINKLSVEVGKAPEKFKALGISATDPLEQFKQLADITNKLSDVNQRNAVLATALGKSWQGAVPLLAEGSQKIGEMVERGSKASGVTAEFARQADELNDKLVLLVGTGGLLTRVVGPLLPLFNTLADEMLKATEQSKNLNQSFSPLLEILKVVIVIGANVSFTFETIGKDIARMFENIRLIAKGDFAGSRALGEVFRKDAAAAREALDAYTATIMRIGTTPPGAPAAAVGKVGDADTAARAARFLGKEDAAKDAEKRAQQIRDIMHAVQEANDKRELEQVALTNDRNLAAQEAFVLQMLQLEEMLQDEKDTIQRESALGRQQREAQERADQIAGALSFTSDLASLMNTQSKKAFELGKVASIANALIKGYEAAVSSYAAGARIGGPYLGATFAAASILATANLINNIRSQHFGGGGGGGGSVGGTPVSPTQGGSNFTSPQQQTGPQITVNLTVNGHILDTQEFTDTILVPALKDAIDNRDVTIIGANSRQAANLVAA